MVHCECQGCQVVGDCCVGGWVRPLADNTILHLSELETGSVRLLGHQITTPPEQRRAVWLVLHTVTHPEYCEVAGEGGTLNQPSGPPRCFRRLLVFTQPFQNLHFAADVHHTKYQLLLLAFVVQVFVMVSFRKILK